MSQIPNLLLCVSREEKKLAEHAEDLYGSLFERQNSEKEVRDIDTVRQAYLSAVEILIGRLIRNSTEVLCGPETIPMFPVVLDLEDSEESLIAIICVLDVEYTKQNKKL